MNDLFPKKHPNIWILAIGVILFLIVSFWNEIERDRYRREYTMLSDRSVEIAGVVSDYGTVMVWLGTSKIDFTNGQKILISGVIRNEKYTISDFYKLVAIGDSIRRPAGYAGKNAIYLYKANEGYKEYYFIEGEIIY